MGAVALPAEPEVVTFDVEWLLALASQHTHYSADLQCEVDDLRTLVKLAWGVLSPAERQKVLVSGEVQSALDGEYLEGAPGVGDDGSQWLIRCAEAHGDGDDPDHEAGDLQDFVRAMWREMYTAQHRQVLEHDDFGDIAELGGCERPMAKAGEEFEAEDWALVVDQFGLDESFQYGEQQVADYLNAFTLQEAIESEESHTQHPMKRAG